MAEEILAFYLLGDGDDTFKSDICLLGIIKTKKRNTANSQG